MNHASSSGRAESPCERAILGWREWIGLPDLGVPAIKCKIDTGARSSALHTFQIEAFSRAGHDWVRFGVHPHQRDASTEVWCEAPVLDVRNVTDSGGHTAERYFIATRVRVGSALLPLELSLTSRDTMLFRMLLGREAMRGRFLVDPGASFVASRRAPITNSQESQ